MFSPAWRPYLIGIAAFAGGWLLRLLFLPLVGTYYPYLHLYPAVLFAAWKGGARGGITAAALSAVSVQFLLPSIPSDTVFIPGHGFATVVFVVAALIVSALAEERRLAVDRADEQERRRAAEERAERAIQASRYREWIDALVADVPAVVWEAWGAPDVAAQRIDFVSRHVERMLGYSVDEWLSTPNFWLTVVHPDDRERAGREARDIFEGRRDGASRFRWVKRTGEVVWVEGKSTVIRDGEGRPVGMRGVTIDISDLLRFETERNDLLERTEFARHAAEEANRLKDEFLMTLSHELRTPLNAVWGWTRILRAGRIDDPRVARGLEVIDRNAAVQLRLIEDLLDISSIIAGKLRIEMELIEMHGVVAAVADSARPAAEAKNVMLTVSPPGGAALVRGDAERLQQALWNLVSNAVKFTPEGGSVAIAITTNGGYVQVAVRDTGAGIGASVLPHIFERFRQGESGTARSHMGLGLGLAIARSLAEAHGGTLTAASDGVGLGATFLLRLALATDADGVASPAPAATVGPEVV